MRHLTHGSTHKSFNRTICFSPRDKPIKVHEEKTLGKAYHSLQQVLIRGKGYTRRNKVQQATEELIILLHIPESLLPKIL